MSHWVTALTLVYEYRACYCQRECKILTATGMPDGITKVGRPIQASSVILFQEIVHFMKQNFRWNFLQFVHSIKQIVHSLNQIIFIHVPVVHMINMEAEVSMPFSKEPITEPYHKPV
jgi:hypothetical protein